MEEIRQLMDADAISLCCRLLLLHRCAERQPFLEKKTEQQVRPHDETIRLCVQLIGNRGLRVLPDAFLLYTALAQRLLPLQLLFSERVKFRQQGLRLCR